MQPKHDCHESHCHRLCRWSKRMPSMDRVTGLWTIPQLSYASFLMDWAHNLLQPQDRSAQIWWEPDVPVAKDCGGRNLKALCLEVRPTQVWFEVQIRSRSRSHTWLLPFPLSASPIILLVSPGTASSIRCLLTYCRLRKMLLENLIPC